MMAQNSQVFNKFNHVFPSTRYCINFYHVPTQKSIHEISLAHHVTEIWLHFPITRLHLLSVDSNCMRLECITDVIH